MPYIIWIKPNLLLQAKPATMLSWTNFSSGTSHGKRSLLGQCLTMMPKRLLIESLVASLMLLAKDLAYLILLGCLCTNYSMICLSILSQDSGPPQTFCNSDDCNSVGQGVLQGSSSACPIYIFNSDVCLSTYRKHATTARFIHPITGTTIQDLGVQFVDDTSQFINSLGCGISFDRCQSQDNIDTLFHHAQ